MRFHVDSVNADVVVSEADGSGASESTRLQTKVHPLELSGHVKQALLAHQDRILRKVHIQSSNGETGDCAYYFNEPITIDDVAGTIISLHFRYSLFPAPMADDDPSFWDFTGDARAQLKFCEDGDCKVITFDGEGNQTLHDLRGYYLTRNGCHFVDQVVLMRNAMGPKGDMLYQRLLQVREFVSGKLAYGNELHLYFDQHDVTGKIPGVHLFDSHDVTGFHIMYTDQADSERPCDLYRRFLDPSAASDGPEPLTQQVFEGLKQSLARACEKADPRQSPYNPEGEYMVAVWLNFKLEQRADTQEITAAGVMPLSMARACVKKFQSSVMLEWEDEFETVRATKRARWMETFGSPDTSEKHSPDDDKVLIDFKCSIATVEQVNRFKTQMKWAIKKWIRTTDF